MRPNAVPPACLPDEVPSRRSRRALDWLVFFVADIQTGFGPFVAVFLTGEKWTQFDIGLVLTVSGLVGLIGQVPFGAIVDAAPSLRAIAAVTLVAIGASAFAFAAWPIFPVVLAARVLHAGASCMLGLAVASISLGLVGAERMSERLGRNVAFASAGTGLAAAAMGAIGYYLSARAVFLLAGALALPALYALLRIRREEIGPTSTVARDAPTTGGSVAAALPAFARNRAFAIFLVCILLFYLANGAMLPLAASMMTLKSSKAATLMVAASIVVPQFIVTLLSPWVGHWAQRIGRKPILLLGFGALALRGFLFASTGDPALLTLVQALDGVSAAVLGVLVPLTAVDVTRRNGHFNLAQGVIGCTMAIGAAASSTLAGYVTDDLGSHTAFAMLAVLAAVSVVILALAMPETKPRS
ncbi:MAG: MFS transporter [Proteobacteria bacterium]|nr:MFS transporter [Pseudomonadota bacterium]